MASFESIKGSPVAALGHCLREKEHYLNEDIDQARSHLNYTISPENHGRSTKECMDYYDSLMEGIYHRGGGTITTGQWVVTAPEDLSKEMQKDFFKCTYDFLNDYFFKGDDSRVLLSQIHMDESSIGRCHMHYVMTMPDIINPKHISMEEKLFSGLNKTQTHFEIMISEKQVREVMGAVQRYEMSGLSSRERYAIRDISEALGLKRDDARWVFTRVRRLESERFEKRLMSKDEFLTREKFDRLHPEYQKWMKDHGFDCTVFKGGEGINLSVDQLKRITKETGYRIVDNKEYEKLQSRVKELEIELQKRKNTSEWNRPSDTVSREWETGVEWGREE